jgi:hypothetical protein
MLNYSHVLTTEVSVVFIIIVLLKRGVAELVLLKQ